MTQISDSILDQISDTKQLETVIMASSRCYPAAGTTCDKLAPISQHSKCLATFETKTAADSHAFSPLPPETESLSSTESSSIERRPVQQTSVPQAKCPKSLVHIIGLVLAKKPNLIDDNIRIRLSDYYKLNKIKATGLVSHDMLKLLHTNCESKLITWIKFEALLVHLIKDYVYEPKTLASEILETVKDDLDSQLAANFSSILNGCVKVCREVNNRRALDEEEQEKWCEIIEWMSWFLAGDDDHDAS